MMPLPWVAGSPLAFSNGSTASESMVLPAAAVRSLRGPTGFAPAAGVSGAARSGAPGSGLFLWPLRGKILSGYGAKDGGLFNDGINIAARRGESVVAAGDGVVVYAGNEIRGFGNLVLIKHANGWMTAYAHNDRLLVRRGERVRRGQTIAKAGSSGGVASPQLHFEVRKGSRAVDPVKYLGPLPA